MRSRHRAALALLLVASVSCASLGGGDPVVVRAQDFLVNSLNLFDAAMAWHYAHSTTESPAAYRVLETARVDFPKAWLAVKEGIDYYKLDRDRTKLQKLIASAQGILDSVSPYIGGR